MSQKSETCGNRLMVCCFKTCLCGKDYTKKITWEMSLMAVQSWVHGAFFSVKEKYGI